MDSGHDTLTTVSTTSATTLCSRAMSSDSRQYHTAASHQVNADGVGGRDKVAALGQVFGGQVQKPLQSSRSVTQNSNGLYPRTPAPQRRLPSPQASIRHGYVLGFN